MKLAAIFLRALVGIAVAQFVTPIPREVRLVEEIPAEWWTHVDLSPAQLSYTVPAGHHFVATSWDGRSGTKFRDLTRCVLHVPKRGAR